MHNPLTDQHCCHLDNVLNNTPQYIQLADACLECGWDWAEQFKQKLLEQQRQAAAIKAKFFPGRP